METYQVGLIALALSALSGLLVYLSWRRKVRNQEASLKEPTFLVPQEIGTACFYVATVFKDRPLDRVVAFGLAHRGFASVSIESEGLAIYRRGEKSFLIPGDDFTGHSRATAVIDKAVEKDGMVVIDWLVGDQALSTYLRIQSNQKRDQFLNELVKRYGVSK